MPRRNDPPQRMIKAWQYYTDPASDTYDNVTQSGVKAGYSYQHSYKNIAFSPYWKQWKIEQEAKQEEEEESRERMRREMLKKAEENLRDTIEQAGISDPKLLNIKHDATKYVTSTLGKDVYSTRTETEQTVKGAVEGETAQILEVTFRKYLTGADVNKTQENAPRQAQGAPSTASYEIINQDNSTTKDQESQKDDKKEQN